MHMLYHRQPKKVLQAIDPRSMEVYTRVFALEHAATLAMPLTGDSRDAAEILTVASGKWRLNEILNMAENFILPKWKEPSPMGEKKEAAMLCITATFNKYSPTGTLKRLTRLYPLTARIPARF